jgi:hypothetical protein
MEYMNKSIMVYRGKKETLVRGTHIGMLKMKDNLQTSQNAPSIPLSLTPHFSFTLNLLFLLQTPPPSQNPNSILLEVTPTLHAIKDLDSLTPIEQGKVRVQYFLPFFLCHAIHTLSSSQTHFLFWSLSNKGLLHLSNSSSKSVN